MPLAKIAILLCLGIIIAYYVPIGEINLKWLFLSACCSLIFAIVSFHSNRSLSSIFILLVCILMGILTYESHQMYYDHNHFSKIAQPDDILIITIDNVNVNSKNIQCKSTVSYAGPSIDTLQRVGGKILVYFPLEEEINLFSGVSLALVNNSYGIFENNNPLTFDYKAFLANKKIYHQSYAYEGGYTILSYDQKNIISGTSDRSRNYVKVLLDNYIHDDKNRAIARAMLLGDRSLVDDELNRAYSDTGAIHILAVSGLHVGLVGWFVLMLLKPIQRFRYTEVIISFIAIMSIWLYVLMTGSGAPSMRAAAMYSCVLGAPLFRRYLSTYNTIGAAAIGILLLNPNQMMTISFQFSFIAVVSIIFFFPHVQKTLTWNSRVANYIWQLVALSISAQILLAPLSIYYFHKFPLLFWLSGIVAIPAAGMIIGLGIALVLTSLIPFVSAYITPIVGQLLEWVITGLNFSINLIDSIPHNIVDGIWIDRISLLILYFGLLIAMIGMTKKKAILIYACAGLFFLQGCYHLYETNKIWKEKNLVVYHIYKNSIAEFIAGGDRTYLLHNVNKESTENWNCKNFRMSKKVNKLTELSEKKIETRHGLIAIDTTLILVNPTKELLNHTVSEEIDLYFYTDDEIEIAKSIIEKYAIKKIVIDGSNIFTKKKIKGLLEERGIEYHDTAISGAFVYEL